MTKSTYNTDNLKITQFDAHGSLSMQIEGRVLRSRARGPFNAEMLEATEVLESPLFAEMSLGGKWVEILEFWNSALATADALAQLDTYLQRIKVKGIAPLATAIVLGDRLEGAAIMRERYAAGQSFIQRVVEQPKEWLVGTEADFLQAIQSKPAEART